MDRIYEFLSSAYGYYKRLFFFLSEPIWKAWDWVLHPQNSNTITLYAWWFAFVGLSVAFLLLLANTGWSWYRSRRPNKRGQKQMSKKAMRAAERTAVEDLITEAFEDAVHKGRIKQETATSWYVKMGRTLGLKGLVPRALPVRSQLRADREEERLRDPERVAALKENLKLRRSKGNGRVLPLPGTEERRPLKDDLNLKLLSLPAPALKRTARRTPRS
jgi:hypothetical protein